MSLVLVPCSVTGGQFQSEYAVKVPLINDDACSFFLPRDQILEQSNGTHAVSCHFIGMVGSNYSVRLPRESYERGRDITVPKLLTDINAHVEET